MIKFDAVYEQLEGDDEQFSHSWERHTAKHSTTLSSVTVTADPGITINDQATASPRFSGRIETPTKGDYRFTLKGTFADGSDKVAVFMVRVYSKDDC